MSNFQKPVTGVEKPESFDGYRKKDFHIKHERLLFTFSDCPNIWVNGRLYILLDLWWGNRLNKNFPVLLERFEEDYEVVQMKADSGAGVGVGGNRGN